MVCWWIVFLINKVTLSILFTFLLAHSLRHACAAPLGPAQGAPNLPPQCSYRCLTVLTSVEALISRGYVTDSTKRPNPKQRKKMKLQKQQQRAS